MIRWRSLVPLALAFVIPHGSPVSASGDPGDQNSATAPPTSTAPAPPRGAEETGSILTRPGPGDAFAESVDINVVNVEVVVRDASGILVPGLTRADFRLFIDGQRTELTNFYVTGTPPFPPAQPTSSSQAPAAATDAPGAGRESLHLVVFVDNANMRPFDRNRLLKQLRTFLHSTLRPGDRVLVRQRVLPGGVLQELEVDKSGAVSLAAMTAGGPAAP